MAMFYPNGGAIDNLPLKELQFFREVTSMEEHALRANSSLRLVILWLDRESNPIGPFGQAKG